MSKLRVEELAQEAADREELERLLEENALLRERVREADACTSNGHLWIIKREDEIRCLKIRIVDLEAQIEREEGDGK